MIAREFTQAIRRDHLATVLAQLCLERGFASATVGEITRRAATSRATFYQLFSGSDDCFVFLVRSAAEELSSVVRDSSSAASDLDRPILAATRAALRWLAENEARASVLLVDAHGGPVDARRAQLALFDSLAARLGRARRHEAAPVADVIEQMLLGGTVAVLRRLAVEGEIARAPDHAEELAFLMTGPPSTGPDLGPTSFT